MGLTRLAIKRPLATVVIFLAFILLGTQAYFKLRVDRFPAMSFPVVFAVINWPGASPEDIEQTILVPAENAVAGASGVDRIDATAREGSARCPWTAVPARPAPVSSTAARTAERFTPGMDWDNLGSTRSGRTGC